MQQSRTMPGIHPSISAGTMDKPNPTVMHKYLQGLLGILVSSHTGFQSELNGFNLRTTLVISTDYQPTQDQQLILACSLFIVPRSNSIEECVYAKAVTFGRSQHTHTNML